MMNVSEQQALQMSRAIQKSFGSALGLETLLGQASRGPRFSPSISLTVGLDVSRKQVRNTDGAEVVSELTVYSRAATLAQFTVGSRVTLDGAVHYVIQAKPVTFNGYVTHIEVVCT